MIQKFGTSQRLSNYIGDCYSVIAVRHSPVTQIDILDSPFRRIMTLAIQHCLLSNLSGIEQFNCLQQLSLKYNQLKDWRQLNRVSQPKLLLKLDLRGNPFDQRIDFNKAKTVFTKLRVFNQPVMKLQIQCKEEQPLKKTQPSSIGVSRFFNIKQVIQQESFKDKQNLKQNSYFTDKESCYRPSLFEHRVSMTKVGRIFDYIQEIDKDLLRLADSCRLGSIFKGWLRAVSNKRIRTKESDESNSVSNRISLRKILV